MARPFHRQQNRAAPLAADADTLDQAENGQQHRAPDADHRISGQERHQKGRDAHQHQGDDQRRLAADAVAVVAKNKRADRARHKADEIDAEGAERRRERVLVGEEQLAEDEAGHGAVEEKIVPLDGGAYRRCDDGATELASMLVWCERIVDVSHRCHCGSLPGCVYFKLAFPLLVAASFERLAYRRDHSTIDCYCQASVGINRFKLKSDRVAALIAWMLVVRVDGLVKDGAKRRRLRRSSILDKIINANRVLSKRSRPLSGPFKNLDRWQAMG